MEPLHITISPNIYLCINAMRDSPLLPGLKNIYIPDGTHLDHSSALFLALVSTLNKVQLDDAAAADRQFFVPFLSSLYIKSPGLSHLAIRGPVLSGSLEPIYHFTKLQSLEMWFGNPDLHPQLPHLLNLIIDIGGVDTSIKPRPGPISISNSKFRQLRHLQIFGIPTSISCVLDELKGLTNLNVLKIHEIRDGTGVSAWNSSFKVISTFSAVEDIEISRLLVRFRRGHYIHSARSLAPLFRLDNLK